MDGDDACGFEKERTWRRDAKIERSNLASASSDELQAESGSYKTSSTCYDEHVTFDAFVFAQMHL